MPRVKRFAFVAILITIWSLGSLGSFGGVKALQPSLVYAADEYEHIRIALPRQLTSIDPHGYPRLSRPDLDVQMNFFEHLFRREEDGSLVGFLATDHKWLNDTTMRIYLRKGVTFSNGDKFTAEDVKWSIEDMLNPDRAPGLAGFLKGIKKVEIIDDYTVDLHTDAPFPTLLSRLACYTPMASAKQRKGADPSVYEKNPLGTGPFKFVEWKKGDRIVMVRNENYWRGVPKIKKLTFFPISDQNTRASALKAGTIDIAMDISPSMAKELKGFPGIEITATPSARVEFTWLRADKPPFNDRRVRQAVNYAVNKEEFVATLLEGYGLPIGQAVPPYFFGYNPKIKPYPYDPEKAKQLLAEAGYPKGLGVTFAIPSIWEERGRGVAGYLEAIGIKCKVVVREQSAHYADLLQRKMPHLLQFNWGNWSLLDLDGTLQFVFGCTKPGQGMWSYYCNPRIEEIIQESKTVDTEKRLKLAQEAAQIIHDEAPLIFLYTHYDIHAKREGIPEFKARLDNTIRLKWVKGE
jgi:peptide/nickel transport system substrate-binding protein